MTIFAPLRSRTLAAVAIEGMAAAMAACMARESHEGKEMREVPAWFDYPSADPRTSDFEGLGGSMQAAGPHGLGNGRRICGSRFSVNLDQPCMQRMSVCLFHAF